MLDVLVVEDDVDVRHALVDALARAGHRVREAGDADNATEIVSRSHFDLAVCDVSLPRGNGIAFFRRLRADAPGTAVVLTTSFGRIRDAVGTLREGALDYVTKPFDPDELVASVVEPLAARVRLRDKLESARAALVARAAGGGVVAESPAMRRLVDRVAIAAQSEAPVFFTGERGSGKERVARILHARGARRAGPLVVAPCAALADLLVEGDGAVLDEEAEHGWMRMAEGGTLVLDGVEQLSPRAQGALLRVLDRARFAARSGRDWRPTGVRLVSLSRLEGSELLASGFLEPLYYGLAAITLRVPPLRERASDLWSLALELIHEATPQERTLPTISPAAWDAMTRHSFPGNVRELAWVIAHATAAAAGGPIELAHLPRELTALGTDR